MDAGPTCRSCGAPAEPGAVLCACGSLLATSVEVDKDPAPAGSFWVGFAGGLVGGVFVLLAYKALAPETRRGALVGFVVQLGLAYYARPLRWMSEG